MGNKLTEKQKKFCKEYIIDLNATQAAIRAGYSEKTARTIAAENLAKPNIQNYISGLQKELQKKTAVTQERVVQELAKIAFLNPKNLYNEDGSVKSIQDLDDETASAIAGIDTNTTTNKDGSEYESRKIKLCCKNSALDKLCKHLGIYNEKLELSGNLGVNNMGTIEIDGIDINFDIGESIDSVES